MDTTLRIDSLTVDIGPGRVIDGISFEVAEGRILGLVGESGSGKTMTALAVLGLLPEGAVIRSGQVLLKGNDIVPMSPEERRRLRGKKAAMSFQEPFTAFNPVMRIGEQVTEAMRAHGMSRAGAEKRLAELSRMVKLSPGICRHYPHELSGGERQRMMIAMALSCGPDLLILDEPTTALDVSVQKHILDLVSELQRRKKFSVLFITHDFSVVNKIADDVAVMKEGRIVEKGSKDKVLKAPGHEYTRKLIGCIPRLGDTRKRLPV
ncbi:MAG: ATP-binding cassette domain-containing protein [Candidatus Omnitrophica bacterium]|nr:ATP-binding cassette domain-containing protein [Candidatus Omnitrophota bacterium]